MNWVWNLNVIDGPLVWILASLGLLALVFLLVRRLDARWYGWAAAAVIAGVLFAAILSWLLIDVFNLFGGPLIAAATPWVFIAFGALGVAVLALCYRASRIRRTVAAVAVLLFLGLGALGINGAYGLQTTVGAMFHINTRDPVALVKPPTTGTDAATGPTAVPPTTGPLYAEWKAPAGMPSTGTHGPLPANNQIPSAHSGFSARPAEVYYPPAALVPNPPALPFVLMMMGQPGDPESKWIAGALDTISAQNNGLAPIVLVVDQLGDPATDPLCIDGRFGNVETYISQDVLPWVRANLHVSPSRQLWTVAGYSAGAACALYYGAKYPQVWGNLVSVSGEEFSGSDTAADNLRVMFNGDQAAYDAIKPARILATGSYPDSVAFFSAGSADPRYLAAMAQNSALTGAAGMLAGSFEVPDGDHGVSSLTGGLDLIFRALYPRLGLAAQPGG